MPDHMQNRDPYIWLEVKWYNANGRAFGNNPQIAGPCFPFDDQFSANKYWLFFKNSNLEVVSQNENEFHCPYIVSQLYK